MWSVDMSAEHPVTVNLSRRSLRGKPSKDSTRLHDDASTTSSVGGLPTNEDSLHELTFRVLQAVNSKPPSDVTRGHLRDWIFE